MTDGLPVRVIRFDPPIELGRLRLDELALYADQVVVRRHFDEQSTKAAFADLKVAVGLMREVCRSRSPMTMGLGSSQHSREAAWT